MLHILSDDQQGATPLIKARCLIYNLRKRASSEFMIMMVLES